MIRDCSLPPSIAKFAFANRPIRREIERKLAHALAINGPLSSRKSTITLSSGTSRPSSQMTSQVSAGLALKPAARLYPVEIAVDAKP